MPSIDTIAAEYVDRAAALDPFQAALAGIDGHDHEVPDLSPDGFAERAGLDRATLTALDAAGAPGHRDQVARAAMQERLSLAVERYDAGDTTSELNVIASWVQDVRELFDLMPAEGEEAAANVAKRMAAVPRAALRRPPRPGSAPSSAGNCCRWPGRRTPAGPRSTPGPRVPSSAPPWIWTRPTRGAGRRSPGCAPS
jgi:hypothetical protein